MGSMPFSVKLDITGICGLARRLEVRPAVICWMNTPAKRVTAHQTRKNVSHPSRYAQNFDEIEFRDSLNNRLNINALSCWSCAYHP